MTDGDSARPILRSSPLEWLGIVVIGAVLTVAWLQAHQRALDPIIDTGRDLYIATRIADGAKLYTDFSYNYPPLGPYLLALIVRIFGGSLAVFETTGAIVGLVTIALIYLIARRTSGTAAAFVASLFFASLSFAGASTWGANYLFPYAYAATIGMMFLLAFLAFLLQFIYSSRSLPLFLGTILFALAASWTKIEYALAAAITFAVVAAVHRFSMRLVAGAGAAALSSLVISCLYFGEHPLDVSWIQSNIFRSSLLGGSSASFFYDQVSGLGNWRMTLTGAVGGAILVSLCAGFLHLLARGASIPVPRSLPVIILVLTGISVLSLLLNTSNLFFRAWAVLQVCTFLLAMSGDRKSPLLMLSTLSFASTLRVPLNVTPQWYGFVLVVPLYLLIAHTLFRELPQRRLYPSRFAFLFLPLILLISASGVIEQHVRFALKQYPVRTLRGMFYDANPGRAQALGELLAHVERMGRPTLVVIPEGVSVNYFSLTRNPISYYLFTPPETGTTASERAVIDEMAKKPPQLIAIVTRDVSEFGSRGFGVDYDQALLAYIRASYSLERAWSKEGFQAVLLRRR